MTQEEEQDDRIAETIERERVRLRNFIRRRVADELDVEDVLQDVFSELVEAYRLMKPVEQVGAWLFRVARNRRAGCGVTACGSLPRPLRRGARPGGRADVSTRSLQRTTRPGR